MQIQEFLKRKDFLSYEEDLFQIPKRKEYLLSQIGHGKKVLDIGCLGGKISALIKSKHNEVWGVELNTEAALKAKDRGVTIKTANVEDGLPFDSESFDFIHAGEIIGHLYDTKFFLEECFRVLNREGVLFLTTPNVNHLKNRLRVLKGQYPEGVGAYPEDHFGDHLRVFNLPKIKELCSQTGFKIEEVFGIPTRVPQGTLKDTALGLWGRVFPSLCQLLMIKSVKTCV